MTVRAPVVVLLPIALLVAIVAAGCPFAGRAPVNEPAPSADPEQVAALHAAVRAGDLEATRTLIEERGVPVDAGDRYDATSLMMAADRGHVALVSYLISQRADVDHRERFFGTGAFDLAAQGEHWDVLPLLIAAGYDNREQALALAIERDRPDLALAAVEAGPIYAGVLDALRARDDVPPNVRAQLDRAKSRPEPLPPTYTADELQRFAGRFESWDASSGNDRQAVVEAAGDGLRITLDDEPPIALRPSGPQRFRAADGSVDAEFWGRLGSVEQLSLRLGDGTRLTMRQSIAEPLGAAAYVPVVVPPAFDEDLAAATEWPQFRGVGASGVGDARHVSDVWDLQSGSGIRWQAELPGLGNSSPIVHDGRVIVTTAVAAGLAQDVRTGLTGAGEQVEEAVEHRWLVLAFDAASGERLWEAEVGRGVPLTKRHFKATQSNSTPVAAGRHIVAVFPTAGLACLDFESGRVLWKHELGGLNASAPGDPGDEWGFASSPVIHDGKIFLQVDTFDAPYLAAWDLASGCELWRTDRDGPPTWATPTVVRGPAGDELVVNGATIRGYDPTTGEELWSLGPNSELVIATPVEQDGLVYVSAGYAPVKPIYALRAGARGELGADALAWSHDRGGAYMPTPLVHRGLLYVVHHNGRIVAYDAASGTPIYKERFSRGGTFTASPVASGRRLFAATEEGLLYVIAAGPEFREIAVNDVGEPLMATPALAGGLMYLRTPRRLIALGD